jgi:magnesium transporter
VILSMAMITSMLVAALAGTLVPVALRIIRGDLAVATGVAFTDSSGFLAFLGLATLLPRFFRPS